LAWFPEKPWSRHARLTGEKNRLEIQLKRVNLALNEIEKNRLLGEEHVSERRSPNAAQHKEARRLDEI